MLLPILSMECQGYAELPEVENKYACGAALKRWKCNKQKTMHYDFLENACKQKNLLAEEKVRLVIVLILHSYHVWQNKTFESF